MPPTAPTTTPSRPVRGYDESDGNAETRALSAIWENPADVREKFGNLAASVEQLVPIAGNGLDALEGAVNDVGGNCKACHDDYRATRG